MIVYSATKYTIIMTEFCFPSNSVYIVYGIVHTADVFAVSTSCVNVR